MYVAIVACAHSICTVSVYILPACKPVCVYMHMLKCQWKILEIRTRKDIIIMLNGNIKFTIIIIYTLYMYVYMRVQVILVMCIV